MRDALSVFDQITSFTSGNVTYEATINNLNLLDSDTFFRITDDALQGNLPAALMMLDDSIRRGFDPQYFIGGWAGHLRDLMVAQDPSTLKLIEAGPEEARRYETQASRCQPYHATNVSRWNLPSCVSASCCIPCRSLLSRNVPQYRTCKLRHNLHHHLPALPLLRRGLRLPSYLRHQLPHLPPMEEEWPHNPLLRTHDPHPAPRSL